MKKVLLIVSVILCITITGCQKSQDSKTNVEDSKVKVEETNNESAEVLTDDLYNFEVSLNGKVYKLPTDYSKFEENGWLIKDGITDTLAPDQYSLSVSIVNNDNVLGFNFVNFSKNELSLEKCKVGGIIIDEFNIKSGLKFEMPKGISIGSSKEDVISAYGEPTEKRETETFSHLIYQLGIYEKIDFNIDEVTGKITNIKIQNFKYTGESDQSNNKAEETNDAVPENISSYTAPKELTEDIFSNNLEFDGVMYNLPAPVAEFDKNGWVLQDGAGQKVAAKDSMKATIRKGNTVLDVRVRNDSPNETDAKNCKVIKLQVREENNVSIVFPKGIKIGSTKADLDSAYGETDLRKSDTTSFLYYKYGRVGSHIDFTIRKEDNTIKAVEVYPEF